MSKEGIIFALTGLLETFFQLKRLKIVVKILIKRTQVIQHVVQKPVVWFYYYFV